MTVPEYNLTPDQITKVGRDTQDAAARAMGVRLPSDSTTQQFDFDNPPSFEEVIKRVPDIVRQIKSES